MAKFQVLSVFIHCLALLDAKRIQKVSSSSLVQAKDKAGAMVSLERLESNETLLPHTKDPIKESLVHRCVMDRANDFADLLKRLEIEGPEHAPEDSISALVDKVVGIKDMQNHRHNSRGHLGNWLHWDSFSSSATQWAKDLEDLEEKLLHWGFDAEAASHRCAKGANDEFNACMVGRASEPALRAQMYPDLGKQVKRRIDIKDFLIHPAATRDGQKVDLWHGPQGVYDLDDALAKASYDWSEVKDGCRKLMEIEANAIKDNVKTQLMGGETAVTGSQVLCMEDPDKMCPEGTYITTKRRRDSARGGAVLAITYPTFKILLSPIGYSIGTTLAGPAGAAAGGMAAMTVGAWIAFAVSYWASLDPEQCACFVRDCMFVPEEKACRMTSVDETPTKNLYASRMPMPGMKCELQYKSEDTCMMVECGNEDYSPLVDDSAPLSSNLYGKLGRDGSGIYNCLSKNSEPTGALTMDALLHDGTKNSIENRVKLFSSLQSHDARFGKVEAIAAPTAKVCADKSDIPDSSGWVSCKYDNMYESSDGETCQCHAGHMYDEELRRCQWCGMSPCGDNEDIPASRHWHFCRGDHMHEKQGGAFCRCDTGYEPSAAGVCHACKAP